VNMVMNLFRVPKRWGVSFLAEQLLASQNGLFMELGTKLNQQFVNALFN